MSVLPSGEMATASTARDVPTLKVLTNAGWERLPTSQRWADPSVLPVARSFPLGLNVMALTSCVPSAEMVPRRCGWARCVTSKSASAPFPPTESARPSGENANAAACSIPCAVLVVVRFSTCEPVRSHSVVGAERDGLDGLPGAGSRHTGEPSRASGVAGASQHHPVARSSRDDPTVGRECNADNAVGLVVERGRECGDRGPDRRGRGPHQVY
jgi:hypothetical protein